MMPEVPAQGGFEVEGAHQMHREMERSVSGGASNIMRDMFADAPEHQPAASDTSVEEVELHRTGMDATSPLSPAVATLDAMVSGGLNRAQESTYDMLRTLNTPPPGSQKHAVDTFQQMSEAQELASHDERRERAALAVSKLRELAGEDVLAGLQVRSRSDSAGSTGANANRGSTSVAL